MFVSKNLKSDIDTSENNQYKSEMFYIWQDFDDFDIANEDDVLEEFLGLERLKPKVNDRIIVTYLNIPHFCFVFEDFILSLFMYLYFCKFFMISD